MSDDDTLTDDVGDSDSTDDIDVLTTTSGAFVPGARDAASAEGAR